MRSFNDIRINEITLSHLKNEASGSINRKPWKAVFVLQRSWFVSENGGGRLSIEEKVSVAAFLNDIQKRVKFRRAAAYSGAAATLIGILSIVFSGFMRFRKKFL